MVIGNGLVAKAFHEIFANDNDVIVFASGVSNSTESLKECFLREELMLRKVLNKNKKIIYFSTCSVSDAYVQNTPYVEHKLALESLMQSTCKNYQIFRLPQLVGFTGNPNTLTNFLYKKIKNNESFELLRDAKRNLIDVEDMANIATTIIKAEKNPRIVNLANPKSISVLKIVEIFEKILDRKAQYELISGVSSYEIDTQLCQQVAEKKGIIFDDNYVERILKKYFL